MNIYIYEVIDASNDEMYFPLGIFSSKEGAILAIKLEADDHEHAITDHGGNGDHEIIKVLERPLNTINSSHGKLVFVMERERSYQEATDLYLWETTKAKEIFDSVGQNIDVTRLIRWLNTSVLGPAQRAQLANYLAVESPTLIEPSATETQPDGKTP